jgi:hypothetical protein
MKGVSGCAFAELAGECKAVRGATLRHTSAVIPGATANLSSHAHGLTAEQRLVYPNSQDRSITLLLFFPSQSGMSLHGFLFG